MRRWEHAALRVFLCLLLEAQHGGFDFERAWEGSRAQFEDHGRQFGRKARQKAVGRLPLTVLEGGADDLVTGDEETA